MVIRHMVCRFMQDCGFTVETAQNGREALDAVKRGLPDIVVTDMQMPNMGGGELIKILKGDAATSAIPIVIVSSRHSEREADCPANFVVFKDIDIEEQLARAVSSLLGIKPKSKSATAD